MLGAEIEQAFVVMMDVVRGGEEVVPHVRVFSPEGDYVIFLPLPDELEERMRQMRLVHGFMAWKMASAFLMCSEIIEPDAISVALVARESCACALRRITRDKKNGVRFSDVEWLPVDCIGDEIENLLPKVETSIDKRTMEELVQVFGRQGEFQVYEERKSVRDA